MNLRGDLIFPQPGPKMEFWTPVNARFETVICVSSKVWAHHVHWVGVTRPCTLLVGDDGQVMTACEHCDPGNAPRRMKGYLHVIRKTENQQCFLCLTENAGFYVQELEKKNSPIRGLQLEVMRVKGKKNAELIVRQHDHLPRVALMIDELDPAPYLEKIFRLRRKLN